MKKHTWLDALENASLVGLGVGSVASLVFKEILYTTTPLSLLVVLGWANRRKFEQLSEQNKASALAELDRQFANRVEQINQQVMSLPTPETIHLLKKNLLQKNREVAESLYAEITAIEQEMYQRISSVEHQELGSVRQDMRVLDDKYSQLAQGLSNVSSHLEQVSASNGVAELEVLVAQVKNDVAQMQHSLENLNTQVRPDVAALEEEVTRLNRQVSKLSPFVDLSSVRQEMSELVRLIGDLVPKRDLTALVSEVRDMHRQQEELRQSVSDIQVAAVGFRRAFSRLTQGGDADTVTADEFDAILSGQLEEEIAKGQEFDLAKMNPVASKLYPELQQMAAGYLENLKSQLSTIQDFTSHLAQQQTYLWDQFHSLPKTLDVVALQRQLQDLSKRIPTSETNLDSFKTRIQEVLQQELQFINQQLQALPNSSQYELVFDLNAKQPGGDSSLLAGSRAILEEALERSQQRLIVIWPWSNQCSLDETLIQKFEQFLRQGRRLDIGWCHLAERDGDRLLSKIKRGWMQESAPPDTLQDTLKQLLRLKRNYPNHFQFKILGTSENFLVSDQSFAVLGIADALKTNTAFSELQLKLRTMDAEVIQRLTNRFDNPVLADDDLTGYWNRAVTRYDLGDKAGAIDDFSHMLTVNPDDAITHNYRGLVHYDLGQVEEAIADFAQSIRLNPNQAAAYCNRAFARSEQGDQGSSISDYSLAIQAKPDWAIAYFYRAMAWQKLENYQEAVTDYSEALRLTPDSAVAFYYRGFTWQKLNNYLNGSTDLETAARLFAARGNTSNAQKALKNLAKLRHLESANRKEEEGAASVLTADPSSEAAPSSVQDQPLLTPDQSEEWTESQIFESQASDSQPAIIALPPVEIDESEQPEESFLTSNGDSHADHADADHTQRNHAEAAVSSPELPTASSPSHPESDGSDAPNSELDTLINFFLSAHASADQDWHSTNGASRFHGAKVESKA